MDKKIYLIIIFSLLVLGVVIYLIIKFTNNKTDKTTDSSELTLQKVCDVYLKLWKGNYCLTNSEFFTETGAPRIDLTDLDQLYNLNQYYTPLQLGSINYGDLAKMHLFKMIDLKELKNFSIDMNRKFIIFNDFLIRICNQFEIKKIDIMDYYFIIMIYIYIVLNNKQSKDENSILFSILYSIFFHAISPGLNIGMSASFTKCSPDNNLLLYIYNVSQDKLDNIDCKTIETADITTFINSISDTTPNKKIYKAKFMDIFGSMMDINDTMDFTHITDYNQIKEAYINIIQFYINNSSTIDDFIKNYSFTLPETNLEIITANKEKIKELINLIVVYIEAINYVLPDLPTILPSIMQLTPTKYNTGDLEKIKTYMDSI